MKVRLDAAAHLLRQTRLDEQVVASTWNYDCGESYGCEFAYQPAQDAVLITRAEPNFVVRLDAEDGVPLNQRDSEGFHDGEPVSLRPDGGFYSSRISSLEAFDANGESLWQKPISDSLSGATVAGPDGTCYISDDQNFFAVRPDGEVAWSKPIRRTWDDCPAVVGKDGLVRVAAHDGTIFCYDAEGNQRWSYQGVRQQETMFPVVKTKLTTGPEGNLYFGTEEGKLHAVDGDGNFLWERQITRAGSLQMYDTPATDENGLVYASGGDERDTIIAFDNQGSEQWRQQVGSVLHLTGAPGGGILVGERGGPLHGLDSQGRRRWVFRENSTFSKPVVGAEGELYVGSSGRHLYRVDPEILSEEQLWQRAQQQADQEQQLDLEVAHQPDWIVVGDSGLQRN